MATMAAITTMQEVIGTLCVFGGLFIIYIFKRIFDPYRCSCGRRIWTAHGILRHLAQPHKYVDPHK